MAEAVGVTVGTVGGSVGAVAQAARIVIESKKGKRSRFMVGECRPGRFSRSDRLDR
jgi:hypothetical protein